VDKKFARTLLLDGYARAGTDFLAEKLIGMFMPIRNHKDAAVHNAILDEVLCMMDDMEVRTKLFRQIAGAILNRPNVAKRGLCRIVADRILALGKH
jgi:hypothetical protein